MNYLKENNYELDDTISEEVTLDNGQLPKGIYKLTNDITFDKEDIESPDALEGDEVQVFEPTCTYGYSSWCRNIPSYTYTNTIKNLC